MNLKKISICGLALALAGIFFIIPAHAQENEVIEVKTNIIQPISVKFLPSRDGVVKGAVSGTIQESTIEKLIFTIKNHPNNDEIWREYIQWDDTFMKEGQIEMPFQFDISEVTIAERFVLTTQFVNEKGDVVAKGSVGARVPEDFAEVSTSLIENLALEVAADVRVSFLFKNGSKTQKVKPELVLIEHAVGGSNVLILDNEEAVEMVANEEKEFTFSFVTPKDPENYIVSVRVVDNKGIPVTGYARENFFIEGDFAEIKSIRVNPDQAIEEGETIEVFVSGVVDNERGELEINLALALDPGNEDIAPVQETRVFNAEEDAFEEAFSFTTPIATREMRVKVQISRNGNIIEEKTNSYISEKESASFLIDIPQQVIEKYGEGGFELWMVVVLALAMITLLVTILHKRKKTLNIFLILVLPFLGISTASAATVIGWEYPEVGEYYNTNSDRGFDTVVFQGNITDSLTGEGYFNGGLTSVKAEFKNAAQTVFTKIVSSDDVQISSDKKEYVFDVHLSDSPEFNALGEGSLNVQVTFYGATSISTGWAGLVNIDETAPTTVLSYSPDSFTNQQIEISATCTDVGGVGCLQEGISAYAPFEFTVQGNFSDGVYENGIRGLEICDKVENCTNKDTTKIDIDFYDPVVPELNTGITVDRDGLSIPLDGEGLLDTNKMAADDEITFSILGAIDPSSDDLTQDANACGRDIDDDTLIKTADRCTPKWFVCAVNHAIDGTPPRREEWSYEYEQTCAERANDWIFIPQSLCGFTFTFPFILEPCN
jgi:hypothetical protein